MIPLSFDSIVRAAAVLNANLYDLALYTPEEGIRLHRFQPCGRCYDSYSVAKAFIMTAVGMLWDEGRVAMTAPVSRYLPLPPDAELGWNLVTVDHALTHRMGIDASFLDTDTDDVNAYPFDDYLRVIFTHPLRYIPGRHMQYSDAAAYLLSRLVSAITGERADTFLHRRLLTPMGFGEVAWSRCPLGYPLGSTGLFVGAQDMVKLGMLYLNGGVYEGKRLLSQAWVDRAIGLEYEFHTMTQNGLFGKGGMYGQGVVFSRENRFAAAWHSYEPQEGGKRLVALMDDVRR